MILFLFFSSSFLWADHWVYDVAPSGEENVRAVTGGGTHVHIDKKTPLIKLIHRLEKKWQFEETFKAYWIGYTDDMYSIAAYKDKAIDPLIKYIHETNSPSARVGAVYTLHLIGINSKIVGRFEEDFENDKARSALLSLLNEPDLQELILSLLIRDPWPTDVPVLFSILEKGTPNEWAFAKAFQRYNIQGRPVHQDLPKEFNDIPLNCKFNKLGKNLIFKLFIIS